MPSESATTGPQHRHHVLDIVARGVAGQEGTDMLAHSWQRCLKRYRLDPGQLVAPPVLPASDLARARSRMADVIDCARPEMNTLFQQLGEPDSAVVLTDLDGVILHLVASREFTDELDSVGFTVGSIWSEAHAGTNGMGTCLAEARPVSVRREDHFFSRLTGLTCSAVPMYDPDNRMIGVLDVTSVSSLAQQHVLVLLGMTARMIENRLLDRRFQQAHLLNFHSRPEFIATLHEGRLAVADDGRVLGANRAALLQLGQQSPEALRHQRIDEIFQTSLGELIERIGVAQFHPVVTYRAGGAHRFFFSAVRGAAPVPGIAAPRPLRTAALRTSAPPAFTDPRLAAHLETARRVIARGTPVLLQGPTGAGKEVVARAVHAASNGARRAFVAVNCASIPETLIESELFGYRAGAFTGAQRTGRRGKILQADGGTLFLDEIGDMPLDLQARLLRVLDDRQVTPLGSEDSQPVDFQLVSASHRNLPALVAEGRFREDLYYRLCGIELVLPGLAERTDLPVLIAQILAEEARGLPLELTAEAERQLLAHPWPGNVRQLRHVLRTAAALADDDGRITLAHLPALASSLQRTASVPAVADDVSTAPSDAAVLDGLTPIELSERLVLLQMLAQHRWKVSHVAKSLHVSRNTLYRKLHRLRIPVAPSGRR